MIFKFLRAKHWQLFFLMIGLPILFQIYFMTTLFSKIAINADPNPEEIFDLMKFFPVIMIIYIAVFFGWFWSIGMGLQRKIPKEIRMKTTQFKVFFFIPLIYIILLTIFVGTLLGGAIQDGTSVDPASIVGSVAIILPLHLLSIFGIFHTLYFVAKTFKTVELQREVSFGDFVGEFVLFWFYFVGVWILQPKINNMVDMKDAEEENTLYTAR